MSESEILHHLVAIRTKLAEHGTTLEDVRERLSLLVGKSDLLTLRVDEVDKRLARVERRVDLIGRSLTN